MTRDEWIEAAGGIAATAVLLGAFHMVMGFPYPWLAVPIAVVVYPLAGLALHVADGRQARRRRR